jgi:predicted nucleotidyltransferase
MKPYLLTSETKRKNLKAIDKIFKFRELLLLNMEIKKIYLFGSFLNLKSRKFAKWRDIDIAIISNDFKGMDGNERRKYIDAFIFNIGSIPSVPLKNEDLLNYYGDPNKDIFFDCFCYTPKEFDAEMFLFISKIKKRYRKVEKNFKQIFLKDFQMVEDKNEPL